MLAVRSTCKRADLKGENWIRLQKFRRKQARQAELLSSACGNDILTSYLSYRVCNILHRRSFYFSQLFPPWTH
jgi:hypothetical protein